MKTPLDEAIEQWTNEFKKDWVYEEIFKAARKWQALERALPSKEEIKDVASGRIHEDDCCQYIIARAILSAMEIE